MCEPIGFAKQLLIIVTSSFKKPAGGPPSDLEEHHINSGDGLPDREEHQISSGDGLPDLEGHPINSGDGPSDRKSIKLIHKHTNQLLKAFLNKLVEDFNANFVCLPQC